jgi:NAD(P)H-nitrite reductase large subunit
MAVDRCVCKAVPFERLMRLVESGLTSVEALSAETGCCTGCGMCEPYVRLVISTGRTSFAVLAPHEAERVLREVARNTEGN